MPSHADQVKQQAKQKAKHSPTKGAGKQPPAAASSKVDDSVSALTAVEILDQKMQDEGTIVGQLRMLSCMQLEDPVKFEEPPPTNLDVDDCMTPALVSRGGRRCSRLRLRFR